MDQIINYKTVEITVRRDDLLHKHISGNKFRKLKYNIEFASKKNYDGILTFGGAFSNHIAATAAAGKIYDIKTIGIIRGEEWKDKIELNSTLNFALKQGMEFYFINREDYRSKNTSVYLNILKDRFPNYYIVPEGGSNDLAIKGCSEIIDFTEDTKYEYVCCAVGTGATISGIANSLLAHQTAIGFAALNDYSILDQINIWSAKRVCNLNIYFDYNLGAYAKINSDLVQFINDFFNKFGIPLDPIYTGKMFMGIFDLIDKNIIKSNSNILVIHTGGLQGIAGINNKLAKKNKELIQVIF